ncbi:hypothetical protein TIFTF001_023299 [Ficus carica]|uniref:Uncharacterized protein n=1 Tax=Ficus carica TaxID=3494 RepID=A0AA88DG59_FICCA|nr:hypothetical protein TIFTF001_023299 [Ficus carica]
MRAPSCPVSTCTQPSKRALPASLCLDRACGCTLSHVEARLPPPEAPTNKKGDLETRRRKGGDLELEREKD